MNAHAILTAIRELKKNDPTEFATFEKDYAEEMTEGVSFWSANSGYITLWKLQEGVEVSGCELEGASRFGDEWGCLKGISNRTITKKMVEREDFYDESDEKETPAVVPVRQETANPMRAFAKAMRANENKKAMKAYIDARMNYVMREEQEEYSIDPNNGGRDFTFVRKNEWNAEEFDSLLCSLCVKIEKKLNSYNAIFGVGATLESSRKKNPKMNEDGHDRHWIVGVCWGVNEEDPFEELYDEDDEVIEDDDEDEDDGSDSDDE